MKNLLNILIIFVITSISVNAQNKINTIKIYAFRDTIVYDTIYPPEVNWAFYKVDMKEQTIQFKSFKTIYKGDSTPDLTNLPALFEENNYDWFKIVNKNKIKVPRIKHKRRKRVWYDFATPSRIGGSPPKIFYINGDTLKEKKHYRKYVLDKDLTKRFNLLKM
ncbi:hypothetical protein ATE84_3828 [Aquimarina sp. MAR_2010_214]|uniref:hypothetical protein n=1 Tax=Aquimarina sp. MAR_2010_214 TaxID=1250026 RepID=UPI000C7056E8|nr:hypothetical protein [Aquimarina sp. MAR_2010_214]PKV51730.1 hypothetical protein ATE84_3828 [Aquimarina sp. MAR_2010_214]